MAQAGGALCAVDGGGLGGVWVVDQAGGPVVPDTHITIGVHVLVVGHSHAVLEQVVQAAADVVGPLHILEHHPQGGGEHVGLVYPPLSTLACTTGMPLAPPAVTGLLTAPPVIP